MRWRCLWMAVALASAGWAQQDEDLLSVTSPSGQIEFKLYSAYPRTADSILPRLAYSVSFHGKPLIATSFLGFDVGDQVPLGEKLGLMNTSREAVNETYTLPTGKTREVRSRYNELIAQYLQNGSQGRMLTMEVRVFDDGVAFRSVVPSMALLENVRLLGEVTQFQFAKDGDAYPLLLEGFRTGYEDQYQRVTLSGIHQDAVVGLPFLIEQPGVGWAAVTEALIDDYPGMYLARVRDRTMKAILAPLGDGTDLVYRGKAPLATPWRVVLIGETAASLIESNIVTSLNPPPAIDTSWIKPGKAVSGGRTMTTAEILSRIDFASESGLEYVSIGEGWPFAANGGTDLTRTIAAIDMSSVLAHARQKNVGVWLWVPWQAVDAQMEEAFALFEKWGVSGVQIDGMNRDDQWMVSFYRRVTQAAAAHRLMLDFHGAYKPDGSERTWPNVLTREAVLGSEYARTGARVNPDHDVMLAFTRMLAGSLDYGPGGFDNVTRAQFEAREQAMTLGTRAHQLALFVVFESPLQVLPDPPEAYRGQRDFDFIRAVPTVWDETRAVGGAVGEFVAIARRRGDDWYLGAIADWSGWDLNVPLDFLGTGEYTAEIYADAEDARTNPKHTTIESRVVTAAGALRLSLAPGGGAAIHFRPAGKL